MSWEEPTRALAGGLPHFAGRVTVSHGAGSATQIRWDRATALRIGRRHPIAQLRLSQVVDRDSRVVAHRIRPGQQRKDEPPEDSLAAYFASTCGTRVACEHKHKLRDLGNLREGQRDDEQRRSNGRLQGLDAGVGLRCRLRCPLRLRSGVELTLTTSVGARGDCAEALLTEVSGQSTQPADDAGRAS